jgi:hypothetical protein
MEQGDYPEARRLLEAALALAQKNDSERQIANGVFEDGLRRCFELGWKENMAYSFVGLAAVSTETDDLERAARILGQVERLDEEIHLKLERYARATRERTEQELQSRLGDVRFAACRDEGRSMPPRGRGIAGVVGSRLIWILRPSAPGTNRTCARGLGGFLRALRSVCTFGGYE